MSANTNKTVEEIMAEIEAKATEARVAKQIATLQTTAGANRMLSAKDSIKLDAIITKLEDITEKPIYGGFQFDENIEKMVTICSTLQFMKKDQRELCEDMLTIIDGDIRNNIIEAYGRLPYIAEPTVIEISGEAVTINEDQMKEASDGIKTDVATLNDYIQILSLELDLLANYEIRQSQADKAFRLAKAKLKKDSLLQAYEEELNAA